MCKACVGGKNTFKIGATKAMKTATMKNATQAEGLSSGFFAGIKFKFILGLCTPALQSKKSLWAFLNEDNDQYQNSDFREHGTRQTLEELV